MIGQIPEPTEVAETHVPVPEATDVAAPAGAEPEYGGRGGLDPVRYGDWEKNGRCIDF